MTVSILIGDCRERMAELPDASVDSAVCDPPYHLTSIVKRFGAANAAPAKVGATGAYARASKGFMGQTWDGGDVAFDPDTWRAVWRVLKPGAHLVAFSGTRTYHRMVCAIEDAGFEVRDQIAWVFGSGFPKSHDVSKAIDKAAGHWRGKAGDAYSDDSKRAFGQHYEQSDKGDPVTAAAAAAGWGTALKPAWEPICLARKPLIGTVAANVLAHGTGALNIDGCRVTTDEQITNHGHGAESGRGNVFGVYAGIEPHQSDGQRLGRWPANLCHDGSDEVLAGFPNAPGQSSAVTGQEPSNAFGGVVRYGNDGMNGGRNVATPRHDSGSAARFFYTAKASAKDRGEGNTHSTVKPVELMRWLCRMVTPPGGTIIDPFAGSGSTLVAADMEQFDAIGCELSPEYAAIAERRVRDRAGLFADVAAA